MRRIYLECSIVNTLPVIGVPVKSRTLSGIDSLLSIVQTTWCSCCAVSIGNSKNAGLLAARILSVDNIVIKIHYKIIIKTLKKELKKKRCRWKQCMEII